MEHLQCCIGHGPEVGSFVSTLEKKSNCRSLLWSDYLIKAETKKKNVYIFENFFLGFYVKIVKKALALKVKTENQKERSLL